MGLSLEGWENIMDREKIESLSREIRELKSQRKAVILAHLYQRGEVQDVADFVGDSLQLAQEAAKTDAEVIVFCGVHFMAESAAILSPDKIVLLPEERAGCPMADMATGEQVRQKKAEHPDAVVVAYVNTSAEVKAEVDLCCTSSNALKVINSIPRDKPILFLPDRNLGQYVAKQSGRDNIIFWEGYCNTHDWVTVEEVEKAKAAHPEAKLMVHPECRPEVAAMADYVGSTAAMIKHAVESPHKSFLVGTEKGILHQLRKQAPDKEFHLVTPRLVCPNMKSTTLEKVKWALEDMEPRVAVAPETREKALRSLERMLAIT